MATREDWLDAGLAILAGQGAPALTIDALTGRLSLTKGSFYHHFKGMPGYRTALLAHFEAVHTSRYILTVEANPADGSQSKLQQLRDLVLQAEDVPGGGQDLEIAMRAWAQQDPEVRAAQERNDRIRMDYLAALCLEITGDAGQAQQLGRMLYLLLIGAGHVLPPLTPEELRAVYTTALHSIVVEESV